MRNECNIIRDILPLYVDEMISEDTVSFVEEHLEKCETCRAELEKMKSPNALEIATSDTQKNGEKPFKAFAKKWKKKKIVLVCSTALITIVIIFGAIFIFNQVQKQALQYSQEYIVGQSGIKGNVNVQQYIDIHQDFDIGANKHGFAVFKEPEKALNTLKELYPDAIALIQTEFSLDELTTENCQWYKTYGAQLEAGTPEEREQVNFVAKFLDIYENSFFEQ